MGGEHNASINSKDSTHTADNIAGNGDKAALRYIKERETITIAYPDGITPINIATERGISGIMMILNIVLALT